MKQPIQQQSGVAMMVAIIMLLLLTIVMVSAVRVTELEEKMAGNLQSQNTAFQAAESALREAEALIASDDALIDVDGEGDLDANPFETFNLLQGPFAIKSELTCAHGFCGKTTFNEAIDFSTVSDSNKRVAGTDISGLYQEPKYIIEVIDIYSDPGFDMNIVTFRVTAQAWGGDDNSRVVLQSTYRRYYPNALLIM